MQTRIEGAFSNLFEYNSKEWKHEIAPSTLHRLLL